MKKGQGLSMNVIIIAAIALLVLVVLVAIFSGRMGLFNQDLNDQTENACSARGGECKEACEANEVQIFGVSDCETPNKCCAASPR
jgi:uncharacterized membrane protein YqiK